MYCVQYRELGPSRRGQRRWKCCGLSTGCPLLLPRLGGSKEQEQEQGQEQVQEQVQGQEQEQVQGKGQQRQQGQEQGKKQVQERGQRWKQQRQEHRQEKM